MANRIGAHRSRGASPGEEVDPSSSSGIEDSGDSHPADGINPDNTPTMKPWGPGKRSYAAQLRQQINVTNMQIRGLLDEVKAELQVIRELIQQLIEHCRKQPNNQSNMEEVIKNLQGTENAIGAAQDKVKNVKVGVAADIENAKVHLGNAWAAAEGNQSLQANIHNVMSELNTRGGISAPAEKSTRPEVMSKPRRLRKIVKNEISDDSDEGERLKKTKKKRETLQNIHAAGANKPAHDLSNGKTLPAPFYPEFWESTNTNNAVKSSEENVREVMPNPFLPK